MKSIIPAIIAGAFALVTAQAQEIGKPAPEFTATNLKGESVSLTTLRGKVVALEWVNFDCPFSKKHYTNGDMAKLQEAYAAKGVVWLSVNSSAKGKPGYLETDKMAEAVTAKGNKATHFIMDTDGKIGKAYGAKTTPHMFIVDKEGKLAYNGAIDSKPTAEAVDIAGADKIFAKALDAVIAGKEVENAKNAPYGCGVKY